MFFTVKHTYRGILNIIRVRIIYLELVNLVVLPFEAEKKLSFGGGVSRPFSLEVRLLNLPLGPVAVATDATLARIRH